MRRQLCGNPVRDALRAIGRKAVDARALYPGEFTADERYRMVEAVLHDNAFPGGMEGHMAERHVQRCVFTIAEWKSGGRRRFVKEVSAAALGELEEVDYMEYDLSPLRRLIGDAGRRLCAQLAAADRAAYLLRLTAMKADLTLLCRKAQALAEVSTTAELVYRIDFYEHAFEVKIITGGRLTAWFMKGT